MLLRSVGVLYVTARSVELGRGRAWSVSPPLQVPGKAFQGDLSSKIGMISTVGIWRVKVNGFDITVSPSAALNKYVSIWSVCGERSSIWS